MAKFGDKTEHIEKVTIEGVEQEVKFTFQHLGVRETMKFVERTGNSDEKRIDELLEHVIRFEDGTRVTWDYFEGLDDGYAVAIRLGAAAYSFLIIGDKKQKNAG